MKCYLDAGTTYSKLIKIEGENRIRTILPSKEVKSLNLTFERVCGHMGIN